MKKILEISLLFSVALLFSSFHNYFVSITTFQFNEKSKHFEISMKIFTNDLENTLEKKSGEKLFLGQEKENPKAEELIKQYISQRVEFKIDGKNIALNYIGREVELDVLWVYYETDKIKGKMNNIEISNTLLTESFEEQSNICHFFIGDFKKSCALSNGIPAAKFPVLWKP